MDNRRYQVQVQQTNKGKHALQGSKPHPETQQKRGICCKTESKRRPKKNQKPTLYNYSLIPRTDWLFWIKSLSLGKITLFGKSQALKKKKAVVPKSKCSEAFHPLHSLATVDAAKANIFVSSLHTPALSSNCFPPHQFKVWDMGWISEYPCLLMPTSSPKHFLSGTANYFVSHQRPPRFQAVVGSSKSHLCPCWQFQEISLLNFPGSW